jgi:2,3-bisphosphoglycerate-dependent phosphoglycerate mutase
VLVRHGETDWNAGTRIQGQFDVPLNERGRWQAGRVAQALAGEVVDAIHSSDLERALSTAQAVAARHGLPVGTDSGLRERGFGAFEGLTYAEIEERHPIEAQRWRRREPGFGPGGGEPLAVFYERAVAAVARIAAAHAGQSLVVVAHGGVLDCVHRAAAGVALDAPRTWQLGNAAINRLLFTDGRFVLVGWDDRSHLEEPLQGAGRAAPGEPGEPASRLE